MKKYKVSSYYKPNISCVECIKETDRSVWVDRGEKIKPEQYRKHGYYGSFFDTLKDAENFLVKRIKEKKLYHEDEIKKLNRILMADIPTMVKTLKQLDNYIEKPKEK